MIEKAKKPTISVVTISYNAEQEIVKTIPSVLAQSFTDYEYVFVDGNSKDGTVSVIESYRDAFEALGVAYRVISEPDKGIYDAMNKGLALAEGEWVLMLNAGDSLFDGNVFEKLFCGKTYSASVIYGETLLRDGEFYKKRKTLPAEVILDHMPFCHQSVFVRSSILQKYGFNVKYRIAADYDLFLRMYLDNVEFDYCKDIFVAIYDLTGASETNPGLNISEKNLIKETLGVEHKSDLRYNVTVREAITKLRMFIKEVVPSYYYSEKKGWHKDIAFFLHDC